MAKVKLKLRPASGRRHKLVVNVDVEKSGNASFFACARHGGGASGSTYFKPHAQYRIRKGERYPRQNESACAYGIAPRRAIASALEKLAKRMRGRSSAFRGEG